MTLANWLSVVAICSLGAMSPGPSLAVVVKNTLSGNRATGLLTAIGHGLGVGLYAFLCVTGLALVITGSPTLFVGLQWLGAGYLLWIGLKSVTAKASSVAEDHGVATSVDGKAGFRSGFLIAFLNPKIALFFIALFSQFIAPDSHVLEKALYATTAAVIDGGWYVLVAIAFSHSLWLEKLQRNAVWLDRFFGVLLIGVAGKLVFELLV